MEENKIPVLEETKIIQLEHPITSFNGQEAWGEIALREPYYHEVSKFYKESESVGAHDAMAGLIAEISKINKVAITKLPIRKFREAQAYLLDFLSWFPKKLPG